MGTVNHLNVTPTVLNTDAIPGTPIGVAVDASGHVIVVTGEGVVYSLSGVGVILNSESLPGSGNPVAITIDDVGNIYIAKNNGTLYRLNVGLTILATDSVSGTPVDITVDTTGSVFVATSAGTIYRRTINLGAISSDTVSGSPTAIFANNTGDVFVTTSGGAVYRLNTALTTLSSGTVSGTPIDVAADSVGNTIVATSEGDLLSISDTITTLASQSLSGTLVGVDLDFAGHVVAANSAGVVFVCNTALSTCSNTATGSPASACAINLVGSIYVVGGTGTAAPGIAPSTTSLSFPTTAIGTPIGSLPTDSFTVFHTSGATLSVSVTSDSAAFEIVGAASFSLSPGGSQVVTVRFNAPSPPLVYSGNIEIQATDGSSTVTETVSVTGEAFEPVPEACYSTSNLNFGSVNTGISQTLTFEVFNCGSDTLEILSIQINTSDPVGVWAVSPTVPPKRSLAVGTNQTFSVTLSVPGGLSSDISYSASIEVTTNDSVNPPIRVISAAGTGHVPVARINIPPQYHNIDYRDVELGFNFSRPLLIRNTGDLTLNFQVSYVDTSDPDRVDFNLETDGGTFSISPSGERIFRQTFSPLTEGNKSITIRIHNTNDNTFSQQDIVLHGVGTPSIPIDAVLLLDRSGSMSETAGEIVKIEALQNAATLFTELLRDGVDYLGLTKYNHTNSNILNLDLIDSVRTNAQTLLSQISDPSGIMPSGYTGIGGAMQTGSGQYVLSPPVSPPDPSHKKVIVVLTDGKENRTPYISDVLDGYNGYPGLFVEHPDLLTYSVGLGIASNINSDRLQAISNRGLGGFYLVTGNLVGLNVFNLENFYFKIFTDAIGHTMVVDPVYQVGLGETLEIPVGIITEDREALFFFIGEIPETYYVFELLDPAGRPVSSSSTIGGMSVQVKRQSNWTFFRVKFPAPDISSDYVGIWKFRVKIDTSSGVIRPTHALSQATHVDILKTGKVRMSFMASVGSDCAFAASVGPDIVLSGEPIQLRAALTVGGWPLPNANVIVTVERPDGTTETIPLYDDGTHNDEASGDGIFGGVYTNTMVSGVYHFLFQANGVTERGESFTRSANRSQFVGTPTKDPRTSLEDCLSCRTLRLILLLGLALQIVIILLLIMLLR